jgi:hypothetical protein
MASSLKSMFPALAPILKGTADSLYAHQRAFVRAGLLKSVPGRGPGSGVHANPESLALFLIGMFTSAGVAENGPYAKSIAHAVPEGGTDALTGAKTFSAALATILADMKLAKRVHEIYVEQNAGFAKIVYDGTEKTLPRKVGEPLAKMTKGRKESTFRGKTVKTIEPINLGIEIEIEIKITIDGDYVRALAEVMAGAAS